MPLYAQIVRAPPDAVWDVLLDVSRRTQWKKICSAAEWASGRRGTVGSVARYARGSTQWLETLIAVEPAARARFEVKSGDGQRPGGWTEWRLQPIKLGTLLVLEVHGRNAFHSLGLKFSKGRWHRRLLRELRTASEPAAPTPPSEGSAAAPERTREELSEGPSPAPRRMKRSRK